MRNPLPLTLLMATIATAHVSAGGAIPSIPTDLQPKVIVSTTTEPIAPGPFEPTWQSLEQYKVPDWYRDAKFGIWAHWGPQCEAEDGDWYARRLYETVIKQNKDHIK